MYLCSIKEERESNMYKPRAVPVLTGKNAAYFNEIQKRAATEDAGFDVKAAFNRMKVIIANTMGRGNDA
jgi:CRISPR/Cas system CSM-associated protein Csm2 small subunit